MNSPQNSITSIWQSPATVFTVNDLAFLLNEPRTDLIAKRMYYYVREGRLLNPRRGIYCKPRYNPEELACLLYTPSYLSLEYVLQRAGVVFQYDSALTALTYRSRTIEMDKLTIRYHQMSSLLITDMRGITNKGNVNIAIPERAFLDTLYINSNYYFDNLRPLNQDVVRELLPIYNSSRLAERCEKFLSYGLE